MQSEWVILVEDKTSCDRPGDQARVSMRASARQVVLSARCMIQRSREVMNRDRPKIKKRRADKRQRGRGIYVEQQLATVELFLNI